MAIESSTDVPQPKVEQMKSNFVRGRPADSWRGAVVFLQKNIFLKKKSKKKIVCSATFEKKNVCSIHYILFCILYLEKIVCSFVWEEKLTCFWSKAK